MKKTKQIKLIDTVSVARGRAEKYIQYDADFVRFLARNFGLKEIKEIDPEEIIKKYNLRGITFGNYVTQEERYFFLFKTVAQLEVLAKMAGHSDFGKGDLIISFGAQGVPHANAHFTPRDNVINLNRGRKGTYNTYFKGESSFVHELGHWLDFYQGRQDKTTPRNFASEITGKAENPKSRVFADVTTKVENDEEYQAKLGTAGKGAKYLRKRVEIFARLFEATVRHHVHAQYPDYIKFFERSYKDFQYYPKAKIESQNITKEIIKILKFK
jgi:hypothetical protein